MCIIHYNGCICRIYVLRYKSHILYRCKLKKRFCYSYKLPLNFSFRPAFHDAHNRRGQTIITSSSVTSNKYRAFCEARQELWTHNVSAECTWHDNRHRRAHTYPYTFTQTHIGGTYPQTQKSTIPLLSMLFDVRSSFLVSQCRLYSSFSFTPNGPRCTVLFHARDTYVPRNALTPINRRRNYRPATAFWPMSARPARTIHFDPPVRSIGTTLKKRLYCSIASYHDRSPPPRASTWATCHFWIGDEFQASFLGILTETSSARNWR